MLDSCFNLKATKYKIQKPSTCYTTFVSLQVHPCPIHTNWVDSSEALLRLDSIRTLRLNLIRMEWCLANWLPAWQIDNRGNYLCRFDWIDLNQQHFRPTLYSPPEVKISEISIHEPSSFLKRGYKLQLIRMIRVDSVELTWIDNIFNPPSKSRSTIFSKSRANRLPACRIDRRGNDSCWFDGIGFTNGFPVCQIANTKDESTLVGCIGEPSASFGSIFCKKSIMQGERCETSTQNMWQSNVAQQVECVSYISLP